MTADARLPRPRVPRGLTRCRWCALPVDHCMCAELPRIAVRTRVVIVMHHAERRKTSNTARLVAGSLVGAEIRVRGLLDDAARAPLPEGRRLLLYPSEDATTLGPEHAGPNVVLLVPDGNFRQAQRATKRDGDLLGAEPIQLAAGPPSRYLLRRAAAPGLLSTIEAVARALAVLEGPEPAAQLEAVFDQFLSRSLAVSGNKAALFRLGLTSERR